MVNRSWLSLLYKACFCLCTIQAVAGQLECTEANQRDDLEACLEAVRTRFEDRALFWFGTTYSTRCPPELEGTIDCNAAGRPTGDSLASRLFWSGTLDTSLLDTYLNVSFTSPPGEYIGCSQQYRSEDTLTFSADPLSDTTHKPWNTRLMPEVTWTAQPGRQYVLFAQAGGYGIMHGVWVNIPESDLASGQILYRWGGPLSSVSVPQPYAFLLFEQPAADLVYDNDFGLSDPFTLFNISQFASYYELIGPRGVSWLLSTYDSYSVERSRQIGIVQNCASLVTEALREKSLVVVPPESLTSSLSVYAEVSVMTEPLYYTYCCQSREVGRTTKNLDPLGDALYEAATLRDGAELAVNLFKRKRFPQPATDFQDELFTVLCVDTDVPYPTVGTPALPLAHLLITNQDVAADGSLGDLSSALLPWRGPTPPNPEPHGYYFLVYQQPGDVDIDPAQHAGADCIEHLRGRCLFNVTSMVAQHGLTLVGATWVRSQNDDYVNMVLNVPQAEACAGRPGYTDPCPILVAGARGHGTSGLAWGLGLLLAALWTLG